MSDVDFSYLWQPLTKISVRKDRSFVWAFVILLFGDSYCSPVLQPNIERTVWPRLVSNTWSSFFKVLHPRNRHLSDPFVYRTLLWSINWFRGKCASFLILWTLTYAHFSFFSYQIVILSFQKDLYLKLLASLSEVSLNVWNVCILIQGCKDQTLPLIQVT